MARSKKDGRRGGAHRMGTRSKWHEAQLVRAARKARRQSREVIGEEIEAAEQDRYQDYLDLQAMDHELSGADFDWHEDYSEWQDRYDYDPWQWEDNFDDGWGDTHHFWDDPPRDPEPRFDVFTAVDRAVRRQGVQAVMNQAHLLAAAFDVSSYEIIRCANLTKAGYIRYA